MTFFLQRNTNINVNAALFLTKMNGNWWVDLNDFKCNKYGLCIMLQVI